MQLNLIGLCTIATKFKCDIEEERNNNYNIIGLARFGQL